MTNTIAPPTLEELNERIVAIEDLRNTWRDLPSKTPFDLELYCLYAVRDGVGAKRQTELEDANNACIELAAKHGYATGHGDTVGDIMREFNAQIPDRAQSPWMDIETAPRDGVSSEQLRLECCAVLSRFVDQIDRTNMVDDHGHNFKMNKDFLDAKALIEGPRDYRVCYHHISNPTNRTSYPMQEPLLTYAEAEKEVAEQKAKSWAVAWIIARDGLVARTPPTHNSPPDVSTSHNHGEGDPSVMPDSSGGEA